MLLCLLLYLKARHNELNYGASEEITSNYRQQAATAIKLMRCSIWCSTTNESNDSSCSICLENYAAGQVKTYSWIKRNAVAGFNFFVQILSLS